MTFSQIPAFLLFQTMLSRTFLSYMSRHNFANVVVSLNSGGEVPGSKIMDIKYYD